MKAMIFAAGIGSRLKPFTDSNPKALLPVHGKPLLQHNIEKLIQFGITDFVVNVHHFAEQIVEFLAKNNNFGVNIQISDETESLLDTGGGLEKAKNFLADNQPVIVQNSDIICNIDYEKIIKFHKSNDALATLAVRNRETSRYLWFNEKNLLCGWENTKTNDQIIVREQNIIEKFAFSGIHIVSQDLLGKLNRGGVYSIIDVYLKMAENHNIMGYNHDFDYWFDVGTPEKYSIVNTYLKEKENNSC